MISPYRENGDGNFGNVGFSLSGVVKKGGLDVGVTLGEVDHSRPDAQEPRARARPKMLGDAQWDGHWSPTLWLHYWRRLSSPVMTCGWQTAPAALPPAGLCVSASHSVGELAPRPPQHGREPVEVRCILPGSKHALERKRIPGFESETVFCHWPSSIGNGSANGPSFTQPQEPLV